MLDIENYNLIDPAPGVELDAIPRLSIKAGALIARNRHQPRLRSRFMEIDGAVEMIAGMEYHHDNFTRMCRALARSRPVDEHALRHEAVAYINRMGQFIAFASSEYSKEFILDVASVMPKAMELKVFRDKFTAHRSVDAPRRDDTPDLMISHAQSLQRIGGRLGHPKPGMRPISLAKVRTIADLPRFLRASWRRNYVGFQLYDGRTSKHVNFILEKDHPVIMAEAYRVIELAITTPITL
jgi:hypothetical protein